VTTRGFGPAEMELIADWFSRVAEAPTNEDVAEKIKGEVKELAEKFPLYRDREL
jgi:glycine hydroxymethyltransferase